MLWQSDLGNGKYRNPILFSDYSDPDVIRVNDTYYLIASSFNYIPGLPILKSHDLVNWTLINYAVKKLPFEHFNKPQHSKGLWAPSIRYHNNKFWIVVAMPDEGIFVTTANSPEEEWSPLQCIWEGKGFIDPCPFWDDDGKAYIIHAYAKSRIGFKSKLGILQADYNTLKTFGEDQFIFDGTQTQPTIEGPKVYKFNDTYFILAPAGGVKTGWQTALRSKSIYGPWEEKIVLEQGYSKINGPHQGGLVQDIDQNWWFLHFQYKGVYGRVVHLQPVRWNDNWPIMGRGVLVGEPVEEYRKPSCKTLQSFSEPPSTDNFFDHKLGLQWQWPANPQANFYSFEKDTKGLCLYPINTTGTDYPVLWECANLLTQKIMCPSFTAETLINISQLPQNCKTGMIIIGGQYATLGIERKKNSLVLYFTESKTSPLNSETRIENTIAHINCKNTDYIKIRMKFNDDGTCNFKAKIDPLTWITPAPAFYSIGGYWVGAKIGIYAISNDALDFSPNSDLSNIRGKVYFEYFKIF